MQSRILVSIHRSDLVAKEACIEGLAIFDGLVSLQGQIKDVWSFEWTTLCAVWLSVWQPSHSAWLRHHGFIPIANLRNAYLRSANLGGANLCSADLRSANLGGANLGGANLCSADLRNADLRNANLRSADLRSADLRSADLGGADLRSADRPGWLPEQWSLTPLGNIVPRGAT
jgi:uncharacterized protein YjbI with pentapeptide repeats